VPDEGSARFLLYLDENSHSRGLAAALRRLGIDVLRATDAGTDGWQDHEQLAFATSQKRVLYTGNVGDFARLHGNYMDQARSHSGIITWKRESGMSIGEQARRLSRVWESLTAEEMIDRVEFLGAWGSA
jgi:hypothetical protein